MNNMHPAPGSEVALSEAYLMAGIALDRLEGMFAQRGSYDPKRPDLWLVGQEDIDRTVFAVQDVVDRLQSLIAATAAHEFQHGVAIRKETRDEVQCATCARS